MLTRAGFRPAGSACPASPPSVLATVRPSRDDPGREKVGHARQPPRSAAATRETAEASPAQLPAVRHRSVGSRPMYLKAPLCQIDPDDASLLHWISIGCLLPQMVRSAQYHLGTSRCRRGASTRWATASESYHPFRPAIADKQLDPTSASRRLAGAPRSSLRRRAGRD